MQQSAMITIHDIPQNSTEWHDIRRNKATGSNADILLTKGLDAALRANLTSINSNYFTERGHILEAEAIELYEAIYSTQVQRPGFVVNEQYPIAGCSPDGIDGDVLLEVKCFNERKHREIAQGDIPLKIMAQVQFNMFICELPSARLIMYNPDIADDAMAFVVREVKRNVQIHANFVKKLFTI